LLGGFEIPFYRFCIILRYPFAIFIGITKVVLCLCVSLIGGLAIPLRCFDCVCGYAFTLVVATAEIKLSSSVAFFRIGLEFLKKLVVGISLLSGKLKSC
jgi:hypothetical protein